MRASRGMGDISPSKMPEKKTITRKDNPNKVSMYKKGGKVKKFDKGGTTTITFVKGSPSQSDLLNAQTYAGMDPSQLQQMASGSTGQSYVAGTPSDFMQQMQDAQTRKANAMAIINEANRQAANETQRENRQYKKGGKVAKKNWIAGAVGKPGALRKQLGVKGDKPIPAGKLAKAAKSSGTLGKRARLAETLKGLRKKK